MNIRIAHCFIAALVSIGPGAPALRAEENYYMMLFAYEGAAVRDTHTFAAFVKTDSDAGKPPVTVHSISWLPTTIDVKLLRAPEVGVNLTLDETLKVAASRNLRIVAWGPYKIEKKLFDRAVGAIEVLKSGTVGYKALDRRYRIGGALNCIHAVSDIAEAPLLDTGTASGSAATALVRNHFNPWILENGRRHDWLINSLGLHRYTIAYADPR